MLETKADFSRRKGWNRSTATRCARDGRIVVTDAGLVDVEASEARLTASADPLKEGVRQRHGRERRDRGLAPASSDAGSSSSSSTRVGTSDSDYRELTKQRARREKAEAQRSELELAERLGQLGDVDAMRRRAQQVARQARDAVMSLRFRLDPLLAGEQDPAKRAELWDRELRQICEELARGAAEPIVRSGE